MCIIAILQALEICEKLQVPLDELALKELIRVEEKRGETELAALLRDKVLFPLSPFVFRLNCGCSKAGRVLRLREVWAAGTAGGASGRAGFAMGTNRAAAASAAAAAPAAERLSGSSPRTVRRPQLRMRSKVISLGMDGSCTKYLSQMSIVRDQLSSAVSSVEKKTRGIFKVLL